MQIFTLGKNGIPLFLFALILFSGTYSYGQENCPTVADPDQSFCDSEEAQIADLEATAASGADLAWYSSQDSDQPIPSTQLLTEGTYFAGTTDENCGIPVEVTIYSQPEILGLESTRAPLTKQSVGTIGICVNNEENPDMYVRDLRTDAPEGYVQWYLSNDPNAEPLDPDTPLEDNTYYYADQENPETGCRTSRSRTRILLNTEPAPEGLALQEFCATDNPTLADIVATGNNRYFNSPTSSTQLSADDLLVDDATYYLTALGEDCESTERLSVTVNLIEADAGNDNTATVFCQSDIESRLNAGETPRDLFLSLLDEGVAIDGAFEPSIDELVADYNNNPIGTFATTYTVTNEAGCEGSAELALTVTENANAGDDINLVYCQSEIEELISNPQQAFTFFSTLIDEDIDQTGTFSPPLQAIAAQYLQNPIGTFTTTYTLGAGSSCEDSSVITITVNEGSDVTAEDIFVEICSNDVGPNPGANDIETYFTNQVTLYSDLPTGGTFDPAPAEILSDFQAAGGIGTFTSVYTVGTDCGESSVSVSVQVIESQDANAGEIQDISVACNATDVIVLDGSILSENATPGGTFSAAEGILDENGNFDPSELEAGEYTITYSVDDSIACVTPGTEGSTTFTITIDEGSVVADDIFVQVCSDEVDANLNVSDVTAYYNSQISLFSDLPLTGTFDPAPAEILSQLQAAGGLGTFATVYTVGTDCGEVSISVSVQVIESQDANAGEIQDITVACNATDVIVLDGSILSENATPGGTFSAAEGILDENGNFDPSIGAGEYTITYSVDDSIACVTPGTESSTTFTITVNEAVDQIEDIAAVLCEGEIDPNLGVNDVDSYFSNLISSNTNLPTGGTFDPTPADLLSQFQAAEGIGTFATVYTVGTDCGEASISVSVQVIESQDANAGTIEDQIFCISNDPLDLSTLLNGATEGGTFSGTGVENGMFGSSNLEAGEYTITYSVDDQANCVTPGTEDSTTFTIEVIQGIDAGADNSTEICNADVPNAEDVEDLFLGLLDEGVSRNGTFSPSIEDLIGQYNNESQIATFTTTYTVTEGNCEDSVELSVTVLESPNNNAGEDMDLAFCSTEGPQNLYDFLGEGVNTAGTFDTLEDGTFDPSESGAGEYTFEYTVTTEGDCGGTDTSTITVTVSDLPEAPEATDATFCISEGATVASLDATGDNIQWYTDEDLTTPANEEDLLTERAYYATQTNGGCESAATMVTVTFNDAAAPTLTQDGDVFCELDRPTIADLEGNINESGTITWYSEETGGTALSSSDLLQNGTTYYATLTDATSACESSQRLAVTVTLETCELLIPEAFSPNGDGINDTFEIANIAEQYPNYRIEIYNRWGNAVFQGNASSPFWDGVSTESGTLGDNVLPVGVYFYILNYNDGQTAPTQGRVYLSR